jgi:hypothetical protein
MARRFVACSSFFAEEEEKMYERRHRWVAAFYVVVAFARLADRCFAHTRETRPQIVRCPRVRVLRCCIRRALQ